MRAIALCLLAGLATAAGAAEPAKPVPSRPAHIATAEQVAADPAGVWTANAPDGSLLTWFLIFGEYLK